MKKFTKVDSFALYKPSGDDISLAHTRSSEMGVLPNSFTRGMGRMTGCLGEIAVNKFIRRSRYVGDSCYTHDIEHKKKRIEVKSKACSSKPKPEYVVSVNFSKDKVPDNDVYFFTRVRKDLMVVWILGWLPTTKYFATSNFMAKGDKDSFGFVYKAAGYHTSISNLNSCFTYK